MLGNISNVLEKFLYYKNFKNIMAKIGETDPRLASMAIVNNNGDRSDCGCFAHYSTGR